MLTWINYVSFGGCFLCESGVGLGEMLALLEREGGGLGYFELLTTTKRDYVILVHELAGRQHLWATLSGTSYFHGVCEGLMLILLVTSYTSINKKDVLRL